MRIDVGCCLRLAVDIGENCGSFPFFSFFLFGLFCFSLSLETIEKLGGLGGLRGALGVDILCNRWYPCPCLIRIRGFPRFATQYLGGG